MSKRANKKAIEAVENMIKEHAKLMAQAEAFWSEFGAAEHPVYNNDLYDMQHDLEEKLESLKRIARMGGKCEILSSLVSANID